MSTATVQTVANADAVKAAAKVAQGTSPAKTGGSKAEILAMVAEGKLGVTEALALIAKLDASNGKITCKVSEKGALSLYGMGRWPVTLYREQWERLFSHREQIEQFIAANAALLKTKGE